MVMRPALDMAGCNKGNLKIKKMCSNNGLPAEKSKCLSDLYSLKAFRRIQIRLGSLIWSRSIDPCFCFNIQAVCAKLRIISTHFGVHPFTHALAEVLDLIARLETSNT